MTTTIEEKQETFTPGGWHVQHLSLPHSRKLPYLIINDDVHSVARVCLEQDARLIAAAPEMLKALNDIYEIDVPDAEWSPTLEKCFGLAREILAKAEGETS